MKVHLLDGTYELFRHHLAPVPERVDAEGRVVTGIVGVLESVISLLGERSVTHLGVATDHVIESFRNDLWPGYKTGAGLDPALTDQFHPLEDALRALGVTVWAMVEHEADDALATAAARAAADPAVEQVVIATPDKDLAQCVVGERVVQFDRRRRETMDESGVVSKFGVRPESIPDYLGLVGDSADGYPGLPGWGAKSAAAVLDRYGHLESIPELGMRWDVPGLRGANKLAMTLAERRAEAVLFRHIATVVRDCPGVLDGPDGVEELRWRGPTPAFEAVAAALARRPSGTGRPPSPPAAAWPEPDRPGRAPRCGSGPRAPVASAPMSEHPVTEKLAELAKRRQEAMNAGSPRAVERQHAKGKMTARERIGELLDEGSFMELDLLARHRAHGMGLENDRPYTDGVITGWGTIDGRKVMVFAQDFTVFGGALGEVHAEKIKKAMDLAASVGVP